MSVYGHEGISTVEGAYVMRCANGRLFIPYDVFPLASNTGNAHWFDLLINVLNQLPSPIPEWEPHRRAVTISAAARKKLQIDATHVEIWACKVSEAEEWYVDEWPERVGYIEPYEQLLMCAEFTSE